MVLMDIKKLIRSRIKELNAEYKKDDGYDMCKSFLEENNVGKIEDFVNIDIYEFIKCLYYIKNNINMSAEECSYFVDSFKDYVMDLDYDDFTNLFDMLFALGHSSQCRIVCEYLREASDFSAMFIFRNIDFDCLKEYSTIDLPDWEKIRALKKIIKGLRNEQKKGDLASIIEKVSLDSDALGSCLSLIEVQKNMIHDKETLELSMDIFSVGSRQKDRTKILNSFYKDYYKPKAILGAVSMVRSFVSGVEKEEIKYYKDAQREIRGYEAFIPLLEEALEKREIVNSRSLVRNVRNEDIKKAVLQLIYEHNMKYYQTLEEQYNKLSKSSVSAYISILNKYNINLSSDICKKLMFNSIEDFEEIVEFISKLGLSTEQVVRVLSITNVNVTRKIKEFIDKGYLVSGFVCANLDLFDENSTSYSSIISNIAILDNYNINPLLFGNTPEVLLLDNNLFKYNFDLIDSYGLLKSLRTTENFNFISDSLLAKKLDSFIELGLFSFIEQDLNLLNSNNIKRLYVLRAMNFEMDSLDTLREVLDTNRFMIGDSSLDEYIPNILLYVDKIPFDFDVNKLESFRNDKNSYLIGGVLISSQKVSRLLDSGYDLYDALFDGVYISDEEYSQMVNSLCLQK